MNFIKFSSIKLNDIEKIFETNLKNGLPEKIAKINLEKYGYNEISHNKISSLKIFFRQFESSFTYLLFGAAIISFILGDVFNSIFIFAFVFINVVLGFIQEYKSSKTASILNKSLSPTCDIKRNNKFIKTESKKLVPGDIIKLEAGDIVPADCRIFNFLNLVVDESILTGESIDIRKNSDNINYGIKELFEATNICFSGTNIKSGYCEAIVFATGKNTEIGKIAKLTQESDTKSIFQEETDKISKFILIIISITLAFLILFKSIISNDNNFIEILIFSIALAVSAIPESLPAVVTFSLSRSAFLLSKKNIIVKKLSSVEDIGSVNILCTDKTGTITENIMSVSDCYYHDKEKHFKYSALSCTLNLEKKEVNNSFDIAIYKSLEKKYQSLILHNKIIKQIPFDPVRKKNSVLINNKKEKVLIIKGAPEEILNSCDIDIAEKNRIIQLSKDYGSQGKRSIVIAIKKINKNNYSENDEKDNFEFITLISFEDPIKSSTIPAVKNAKKMNIIVKIITGDSVEVSASVAYRIGIIKNINDVITGSDLDKITDEKKLEELCLSHNLFARCTPIHKYKIINILQKNNRVAFLGEGINDAPAVKKAHVGIVVKDASDIARDAADIILLNKNLSTIIDSIKQGRIIVANISKYIKATLASNFGNFYAIIISMFFVKFLPMLPIQILLLNLLSDFPMMSIATDTVENEQLEKPTKFNLKEFILSTTILGLVSTCFDLLFFFIFLPSGEKTLQTAWFVGSVLTELVLIYSIRTNKFSFKSIKPSKIIIYLTILCSLVAIFIPFITFDKIGFVNLDLKNYSIILILVVGYFLTTELSKIFYNKFLNKNKTF